MTEQRQIEPWPKWVRYPLVAVLVVLSLVGIVAVLHGHVAAAVIRTVLIVTLVPILFGPLQSWGLRRRADRLRPRFDAELGSLAELVDLEREVEPARRTSGAPDESLGEAGAVVARARNLLVVGADRTAAAYVEELGRSAASWSGPLGRQLASCVGLARTLGKGSRRAGSAPR